MLVDKSLHMKSKVYWFSDTGIASLEHTRTSIAGACVWQRTGSGVSEKGGTTLWQDDHLPPNTSLCLIVYKPPERVWRGKNSLSHLSLVARTSAFCGSLTALSCWAPRGTLGCCVGTEPSHDLGLGVGAPCCSMPVCREHRGVACRASVIQSWWKELCLFGLSHLPAFGQTSERCLYNVPTCSYFQKYSNISNGFPASSAVDCITLSVCWAMIKLGHAHSKERKKKGEYRKVFSVELLL